MKPLLTDPVVLICSGIIIVGIIGLFWAVGKFRKLKSGEPDYAPADEFLPVAAAAPDLRDMDFRTPAMTAQASAKPAATVSKDVSDRLESMTQRLAEMQTVLMKQSSGSAPGGPATAAGGVGQGFSPETIEKLLKIIGNVIQQVDILQKNLNLPKDGAGAKAEATTPFTKI